MRRIIVFASIFTMFFTIAPAMAVSPLGQRYINEIIDGNAATLRRAAKGIYHNGIRDREVLDVLSEKLLESYNYNGRTGIDAISWGCKAIGRSGDLRYKNVLETIKNNTGYRKIRKYAEKSLRMMPMGESKHPYIKGSVNLAAMRRKLEKGQYNIPVIYRSKHLKAKPHTHQKASSLSEIKKGMSLQEVNSLIGYPTSTTSHLTGKTFIPFYYGGDSARRINLYKGKGKIIFTHTSGFSRTWRVKKVIIDPKETGYPR